MKRAFVALPLVSVWASADSRTDLDNIGLVYKACVDKAVGNAAIKACAAAALSAAVAVREREYKSITARLKATSGDGKRDRQSTEILRRLDLSERAWAAYRDAQCDLETFDTGESYTEDCKYNETVKRVYRLDDISRVRKNSAVGKRK